MFARLEWCLVCTCAFVLCALGSALPAWLFFPALAVAGGAVLVWAIRPGSAAGRAGVRTRLTTAAAAGTAGFVLGEVLHLAVAVVVAIGLALGLALSGWALRRTAAEPAPPVPPPAEPGAPVETLALEELCRLWQRSYLQLLRTHGDAHASVVTARRGYLDELEHRNPAGFARWLDNGARPSSDPFRYLRSADAGGGTRPRTP